MLMMVRDTNMNFSGPVLRTMVISDEAQLSEWWRPQQREQGYKATFFQFFRRTHKGHKHRNVGPQRPQSELLGHTKGHNQIAYTFWRATKPQVQGCGLKSISDKGKSFETTSFFKGLGFWGWTPANPKPQKCDIYIR